MCISLPCLYTDSSTILNEPYEVFVNQETSRTVAIVFGKFDNRFFYKLFGNDKYYALFITKNKKENYFMEYIDIRTKLFDRIYCYDLRHHPLLIQTIEQILRQWNIETRKTKKHPNWMKWDLVNRMGKIWVEYELMIEHRRNRNKSYHKYIKDNEDEPILKRKKNANNTNNKNIKQRELKRYKNEIPSPRSYLKQSNQTTSSITRKRKRMNDHTKINLNDLWAQEKKRRIN